MIFILILDNSNRDLKTVTWIQNLSYVQITLFLIFLKPHKQHNFTYNLYFHAYSSKTKNYNKNNHDINHTLYFNLYNHTTTTNIIKNNNNNTSNKHKIITKIAYQSSKVEATGI